MSWPAFATLQLEGDGAVVWLRLNRPARLNALTEESFADLGAALAAVTAGGAARVLIVTGNGRGFCAGSDVDALRDRFGWTAAEQLERFERMGREVVRGLYDLAIPTIAAVNGPASGGGLSLALACDIRVASDAAMVRFGYTAMGLIPDLGATFFLPRVIGRSRACRLLWTNAEVSAAEALSVGLVDEVVPAHELGRRVAALAADIASAPVAAVRLGRAALRAGCDGTLAEALDAEAAAQSLCLGSAEHRDRVEAFLRRRGVAGGGATGMRADGARGDPS